MAIDIDPTIGQRLLIRRQMLNMTRKELARSAALSVKALKAYECQRLPVSGETLIRLAAALGTSIHWLAGGSEDTVGQATSPASTESRASVGRGKLETEPASARSGSAAATELLRYEILYDRRAARTQSWILFALFAVALAALVVKTIYILFWGHVDLPRLLTITLSGEKADISGLRLPISTEAVVATIAVFAGKSIVRRLLGLFRLARPPERDPNT